jgi:hypothetical protein
MRLTEVAPQDGMNLLCGGRSRGRKRIALRVKVPGHDARSDVALPGVVGRLHSDVAMFDQGLGDLALLRPHELAQAITHPTDRISYVPVLRRVQEVSKGLPHRG